MSRAGTTGSAMGGVLQRYPVAVPVAAAVTFAIFFVMTILIATGRSALTEEVQGRIVDFVRVKQDEDVSRKDRKPDRPPAPDKPPPQPDVPQQQMNAQSIKQDFSIGAVSADVDVDLSAGLGGGSSDGDYLPIVKVAPVYPQSALRRGIEGWVMVEFTVTESGAVTDARAIDADPPDLFEQAAVEAALKFRYKPRVIDGKPVAVSGVQNLIRFELER